MKKNFALMSSLAIAASLNLANGESVSAEQASTTETPQKVEECCTVETIESAKAKVDEAKAAVDAQTAVVEKVQSELDNIEEHYNVQAEYVAEMEQLVEKATPENIAQAEEEVTKKKEEVANVEESNKRLEETLKNQEENLKVLQDNILVTEKNVEERQAEADEAQTAVEEAQKKVDKSDLTAAKEAHQKASQAVEENIKNQTAKQAELDAASEELATAIANDEVVAEKITEKETEKADLESEKATKEEKIALVGKKITQAEKNVKTATNEKEAAEQTLAKEKAATKEANTPSEKSYYSFYGQEEVAEGNDFVGISGEIIRKNEEKVKQLVDKINVIRQEAVDLGWVERFVPIRWSKDLEISATLRAAEVELSGGHDRPSNKSWPGSAENIAWNWERDVSGYEMAIDQFYREKDIYEAQLRGERMNEVSGHYTSLINPNYTHFAMGGFVEESKKTWTNFVQLFDRVNSTTTVDETAVYDTNDPLAIDLLIETDKKHINNLVLSTPKVTIDVNQSYKFSVLGEHIFLDHYWDREIVRNIELRTSDVWSSSDENIVRYEPSKGVFYGVKPGETTINLNYNGQTLSATIKVLDISQLEQEVQDKTDVLTRAQTILTTAEIEKTIVEEELTTINKNITSIENEIDELQATSKEATVVKDKLSVLEAQLNALFDEHEQLLTNLTEADKKVVELEEVTASLVTELENAQTLLKDKQAALRNAKADLALLQLKQTSEQEAIGKTKDVIELNNKNIFELLGELGELESSLLNLTNALTYLEPAREVLQNMLDYLEEKKVIVEKEIAKLPELVATYNQLVKDNEELLALCNFVLNPEEEEKEKEDKADDTKVVDKDEKKDKSSDSDKVKVATTMKNSTITTNKSAMLPETGEEEISIFGPAALAIIAGLGLVAPTIHRRKG